MEATVPRPFCSKCHTRLADKRQYGGGYRDTCSLCRRPAGWNDPRPEKERLAQAEYRAKMTPHERPKCAQCNKNFCKLQSWRLGLKKDGTPYYHRMCSVCRRARSKPEQPDYHHRGYRKVAFRAAGKDPHCTNCGFVPIHICQLDVDHIDGNKSNSDINNLQILCANCHRLKTRIHNDDQRWMEAARERARWVEPS